MCQYLLLSCVCAETALKNNNAIKKTIIALIITIASIIALQEDRTDTNLYAFLMYASQKICIDL